MNSEPKSAAIMPFRVCRFDALTVRLGVLWVMVFAIGCSQCHRASAEERPNVLFIAIDDLNDWIGCLDGHPQTLTPNIDALAKRGVLFTNAHCASPACNPSRAAVFSGRTADHTGVWSNESPRLLENMPEILTIPRAFENAGYVTLATGKLLHGGRKENLKVFKDSFDPEQRWSPLTSEQVEYTTQELPSKGTSNPRHVIPRPSGSPIVLPLNRMPSDRRPSGKSGESFDWGPFDVDDGEMGDTQITNWAMERLSEDFSGKPFFLAVGYYRPHIPLWVPSKYFDPFPIDKIQLPPHRDDDLDDLGATGKRWALDAITAGSHATVVKFNQWHAAVQAYLACIHYIDHEVGRLIAKLDSGPHRENTLVILWSDHGWHLGEKQHWGKWTPWERATRVPLIIVPPTASPPNRSPDQPAPLLPFAVGGSICEQPVSLLDLYPTLTDACRVPGPNELDGQSLVPLLREPSLPSDRHILTTFDPGNRSIRYRQWRYIRYEDDTEELYDLQADPNEWQNRIDDPAYASLLKTFRDR